MFNKTIIAAAVSAAVAVSVTPAFAQQQGQSSGQQQQSNQKWQQEQTQAQGAQIYLSTASVREIQQALTEKGFDTNIDGQWNKNTEKAAKNYQKSNDLEPTGTPTIALLNSLGLNNVLQGQQSGQQSAQKSGQQQGGQQQSGQQSAQQMGQKQSGQQQGQQSAQQSGQQKKQGGQSGDMKFSQEKAKGQGTPLYVGTASVRQVQQALNKQGYDVGKVDGKWGQSTSSAAMNYQRAKGLEPNGKLDINLISSLGVSQQIFSAGQSGQSSDMKWTQESAAGKGTPLWASPATVRQVEQGLSQKGFDAGNVDGKWDNQTTQAAESFQREQGIEPTGTLTTQLFNALGMNNWMSGQGTEQTSQIGQGQQGQQQQAGQPSQQQQSQEQQEQVSQQQGQQGQQGEQRLEPEEDNIYIDESQAQTGGQ